MATVAVPGIFPPRRLNDWELVDGAVLNPVPVSVARMLAPDLPVVAVILTEALGSSAKTWTMPIPSYVPRSIVKRLARLSYAHPTPQVSLRWPRGSMSTSRRKGAS